MRPGRTFLWVFSLPAINTFLILSLAYTDGEQYWVRDMGEMYVERAVKNILQREMYGIKHGLQDSASSLVVVLVETGWRGE